MFSIRTAMAVAGIMCSMALAVGSASGSRLSTTSTTLRALWSAAEFTEPLGGRVRCPLTLEGSFHARTIVKGAYNLIGYITRAVAGQPVTCTGGDATMLAETLPWHIRYQSFTGTLPRISSVRTLIAGMSFRVNWSGINCLFISTEAEHASGAFNVSVGAYTSISLAGSITSNEDCALGARIRGTLGGTSTSLTAQGSSSRITVTLI